MCRDFAIDEMQKLLKQNMMCPPGIECEEKRKDVTRAYALLLFHLNMDQQRDLFLSEKVPEVSCTEFCNNLCRFGSAECPLDALSSAIRYLVLHQNFCTVVCLLISVRK